MEYLKLLGIVIIVVGFALKWDTTAVVVLAAIVTAVFSGMSIPDLLTTCLLYTSDAADEL